MTRFRLPHGAMNLDMYDGTRYKGRGNARRGMTVEVDDPRHARKIAQMGAVEGSVHSVDFMPPSCGEAECDGCGFSAYRWQHTCPRCGGQITIKENQ